MPKEIERKFLVKSNEFKILAKGVYYYQGYLSTRKNCVVRVRIAGEKAFLTIKGKNINATREEFEYEIPVSDAQFMLENLCGKPCIEKYRYTFNFNGFIWEIDDFRGENQGLVIAEIELESEEQHFEKPDWIGEEVTGNLKYYNSNLVKKPFCKW